MESLKACLVSLHLWQRQPKTGEEEAVVVVRGDQSWSRQEGRRNGESGRENYTNQVKFGRGKSRLPVAALERVVAGRRGLWYHMTTTGLE